MADNNFIEIKIDTESVVDSASKVAQALGQQGENAGNNLGQGIAKGLERSLSRIKMNFGRTQFFNPDATQIYFDEQGAERYRRSIMSMTDEYFRLQEVMRQTQEQRAEMQARLDLMAEGDENSDYFLGMSAGIEEADLAIEGLTEEMQALHRAITSTEDGQRYFDYANEQLANSTNETAQAEGEHNRQLTRTNRTMTKTVSLSKLVSGAFSKLKTIAGGVFKALHRDTNNTFRKGLGNILKYALGIGTVAVAVNKLKSAVKEGFGHLYSYSSDVRKTMMSVTSSLGMFKNQIGASFEPILNVVAPILNQFISLLTQASVAVTNFFATLTGQSYIYKAVDDVKDLSTGLGGASKKAKELKGQLQGFDELNVINSQDDSGGGGGSTGTFEKVATEMSDFAKLIKDMIDAGDWEGVGGALADKIATVLKNINWNKIRSKSRKFGENLSALIKGFFDPKYGLGEEIGNAIAQSINTGFDFVDGLVSDRQMWKNIGVSFAQGIDAFVEGIDGDLIARTINDLFLGAIDGARAFFEEGKAKDTFHKLGVKIGELIKEIKWEDILLGIGDIILEAIGACVAVIKGLNDSGAFDRIGEVINNVLSDKEFWTKAFTTVADAIFEALQAVTDIWNGAFDGHPIAKFIATGIATALIGSKVVGILGGGITSMLGAFGVTSAVSAGGTALGSTFAIFFTSAIVAGVEGFELGKVIGKKMFPDDAEWYDNFRWTGEGGFFDAYVANFTEVGMRADIEAYQEQLRVLGNCYNNLTAEQIAFANSTATVMHWDAESYADQINAVTLALEGYSEGMTLTEMGFASWTEYGDAMIEQLAEQGVTITGNTDLYNNFFGLMDAGVYKINENATGLEDLIIVSDEYASTLDNTTDAIDTMNTTMGTIKATDWGEYYKNQALSLDDVSTSATGVSETLPTVDTNLKDVSSSMTDFANNNDIAVISLQGTEEEVVTLAEALTDTQPVLDDFNTVWEETFTNISDSTLETLTNMGSAMNEIFNGIILSVEVACNSIIAGINGVIRALNALSINIPDITDPSSGKVYKGQNISFALAELSNVSIPRLAQGAVIPANKEFMAVLGDQHNGTNIEAPLDTIKLALAEVLGEFSGSGNEPIIVQIDGREVFRAVRKQNDIYRKSNGASALS